MYGEVTTSMAVTITVRVTLHEARKNSDMNSINIKRMGDTSLKKIRPP
ncbi:hypothetical protein [Mariprofundus erugo]|nr:hypothetical protein [Mariprofundus erugo]